MRVDQLISDVPLSAWVNGGAPSALAGEAAAADAFYRRASAMFPADAILHNNLGLLRQLQDRLDDAIAAYRRAIALDPALRPARRNLALLLVRIGRSEEARGLLYGEIADEFEGLPWLRQVISAAMGERDLRFAGELAGVLAMSRWGSRFYPADRGN